MTRPRQTPCYGSVLIDDELWQAATAVNGYGAKWVYGCTLEYGHDGDHGAPLHESDDESQQWLRWTDGGRARMDRIDPSPPGRHSASHSAPAGESPTLPMPSIGTTSPTEVDALMAVAAAIDRLADAIAQFSANRERGT